MKSSLARIWIALVLAGCEGAPAPYCGGFEDPLFYELSLAKLTLEVDELTPVVGELCIEQPSCECVPTDAAGLARVEVPQNTEIFGEVHAVGYVGTMIVHTSGTEDRFAVMRVIDRATLTIIGGTIGERIDRSLGQVAMRIAPAEGADVSGSVFVLTNLDTGTTERVIYASGGVPSLDATATDETGIVFGLNLAPGRYEIASPGLATCGIVDAGWPRRDAEGRLLALGFLVRPDRVTLIDALRCFGEP